MKLLGKPSPFHLFTNPCVINRFIFGQGVVIYYISKVRIRTHCFPWATRVTFFLEISRLVKAILLLYQNHIIDH